MCIRQIIDESKVYMYTNLCVLRNNILIILTNNCEIILFSA